MIPSPMHRSGDPDDRFALAMAASGIGMAITDLDGQWLEVNPVVERMLGYPADQMLGRPASAFTHPDDIARSHAAIADLTAGRIAVIDAPKRYLHRDGHVVWTHANVALLRDGRGRPHGLLVQIRDVGPERAAREQLAEHEQRRDQQLQASQKQLQLFADAVAHDLRAPLRSIESFSALLGDRAAQRLDDTDRDYLARIRAAAGRMGSLLSALSELSRATGAEFRPQQVDLSLLAEWVGAELQDAEQHAGSADDPVPVQVQPGLSAWGDERLLKQLLVQLLGNAWKFSRARPPVQIRVEGERVGDRLQLRIRDRGIGFDQRFGHKLFEPFQRLHGPDQGGGHGLGLAIARRIVDRHGGSIAAHSQPEHGTTVTVELPAAAPADAASDGTASNGTAPDGTAPDGTASTVAATAAPGKESRDA